MKINYFDGKSSISHSAFIENNKGDFFLILDDKHQKISNWKVLDKSDDYYRIEIQTDTKGVIVLNDNEAIQHLRTIGFIQNSFLFSLSKSTKIIGLTSSLVMVSCILYLYGLTFFIDKIVSLIPKEAEIYLIEKTSNQFESDEIIVKKDSTIFILNKCERILFDLAEVTYPLDIKLVDSNIKNAFSLPGGKIFIFKGLLKEMESEDELFALLLHEVAHIEKRHGLKRIVRSTIIGTMVSAVIQDISGISAVIAENSSLLLELSYNREEEHESDVFSYEIGTVLGIKNIALSNLFTHAFLDSNNIEIPEFLSTHPNTKERINFLNSLNVSEKKHALLSKNEFNYLLK